MVRKLQASKGMVAWGAEATSYTKATEVKTPFGLITSAIDWPVANPKTPKGTGGHRRGPFLYSADEYDLSFSIPFEVLDANVPFQCALGKVEAVTGTGYTGKKFTELDTLPTITVQHWQADTTFLESFIGCKADLSLSAKRGEALVATMDFVAASREVSTTTSSFPTVTVPSLQPYRFWMIGGRATVGSTALASVTSVDLKWSNSLSAMGGDGARGAYVISEDEAEGKYDMQIGFLPTDASQFAAAWANGDPVDITIPFIRAGSTVTAATDAVIITLEDCVIMDAPIPLADKGSLESTLIVGPKDTSIEIRVPKGE
ncbi:MAG TPA: phage tail tube protein [Methanoculleus sp.]|nr:phage tail tube protein [Methanoculleus sp.]